MTCLSTYKDHVKTSFQRHRTSEKIINDVLYRVGFLTDENNLMRGHNPVLTSLQGEENQVEEIRCIRLFIYLFIYLLFVFKS